MVPNDLKPINGQVIVIDIKKPEKTESGIYIPDNSSPDMVVEGVVVESSSWRDKEHIIEPEIKKGDKVMYSFHSGAGNTMILDDGSVCRIVRYSEILAKVEEDETT
jgi:chaperonin GroES